LHQFVQVIERSPHFDPDYPSDLACAVDVILLGRLDQTESIYIANIRLAFGPEQIEAAHVLFESLRYLPGDFFLLRCQVYWISYLFAI
jgi:hypothetical protein